VGGCVGCCMPLSQSVFLYSSLHVPACQPTRLPSQPISQHSCLSQT